MKLYLVFAFCIHHVVQKGTDHASPHLWWNGFERFPEVVQGIKKRCLDIITQFFNRHGFGPFSRAKAAYCQLSGQGFNPEHGGAYG